MLRIALITASIALASPTHADCYRGPDSLDTGFTANNVARTVCLQDQLAADTELRSQLQQLQMQVDALNRQQQLERVRRPVVVPVIR